MKVLYEIRDSFGGKCTAQGAAVYAVIMAMVDAAADAARETATSACVCVHAHKVNAGGVYAGEAGFMTAHIDKTGRVSIAWDFLHGRKYETVIANWVKVTELK